MTQSAVRLLRRLHEGRCAPSGAIYRNCVQKGTKAPGSAKKARWGGAVALGDRAGSDANEGEIATLEAEKGGATP